MWKIKEKCLGRNIYAFSILFDSEQFIYWHNRTYNHKTAFLHQNLLTHHWNPSHQHLFWKQWQAKIKKTPSSRSNSKFNKFQNQKYKYKHQWNNNVHTSKEITIILGINSFHLKTPPNQWKKLCWAMLIMLSYESYDNFM